MNNSLAPIDFDLDIKKPFYFHNFQNSTERFSLKPKSKQKVDVLFKLDTHLINQVEFNGKPNVRIDEFIHVNYSKELNQRIPITAKIMSTDLKATRDFIDFGLSLVGQERCQQFSLRNPSSSPFLWKINIENNHSNVFECNLKNGYLDASQYFVTNSEQIISVYFTAK